MKILVTGGAGFIGSHIVDVYVAEGHEVTVVDDLSTGSEENINPEAKFIKIDICEKQLESVFKSGHFDCMSHQAANIVVRQSIENPIYDANTNIVGTLSVLELCRRYGVKKFIFASSVAVYGEPEYIPVDETHRIAPLSQYGVSKFCAEKYCDLYRRTYDIQRITFRYSNVYGPRQRHDSEAGVISIFINNILNDEPPTIFGDGDQIRDFVYVGDIANANLIALKTEESGVFNLGCGKPYTVNQLLGIFSSIFNKEIRHIHADKRPGDIKMMAISSGKAVGQLGWESPIELYEGLENTVRWFKDGERKGNDKAQGRGSSRKA